MIFPLVLTAAEIFLLVKGRKNQELYKKGRVFDLAGIALGALYSLIYLSFFDEVLFDMNWQEQLVNGQTHTPVYTEAWLTVIAAALAAVTGYLSVCCSRPGQSVIRCGSGSRALRRMKPENSSIWKEGESFTGVTAFWQNRSAGPWRHFC